MIRRPCRQHISSIGLVEIGWAVFSEWWIVGLACKNKVSSGWNVENEIQSLARAVPVLFQDVAACTSGRWMRDRRQGRRERMTGRFRLCDSIVSRFSPLHAYLFLFKLMNCLVLPTCQCYCVHWLTKREFSLSWLSCPHRAYHERSQAICIP